MPELEWIKQALYDRMPSKVAERTGLSVNTIVAIRTGRNINPKVATLELLAQYLKGDGE